MNDMWWLLRDGATSAHAQMALDERLAQDAVLTARVFQWRAPAISLGWKQPMPDWLDLSAWRARGLELVERPTGGGIALHGSDVSVSIVVPRDAALPLDTLMRMVCQSAVRLCASYGVDAAALDARGRHRIRYCLADPSPYAVCIEGRKVAGFALRRYPKSWLVQGSLLVRPLDAVLAQAIPQPDTEALAARATTLSEEAGMPVEESEVAARWLEGWVAWWDAQLIEVG